VTGLRAGTWAPIVDRGRALGDRLELVGVPTVYVNGRLVRDKPLLDVIAEERAKADAKIRSGIAPRDVYVIMSRENDGH
jgi:hypothetical protein